MHQGPWHRSEDFLPNRLLKNAHQSRASRDFPYPSPCQARGRLIAAYLQVRLIPQDFGSPRKRDFEDSTCVCLPAEASAQVGAFLSSLKNNHFFRNLLKDEFGRSTRWFWEGGRMMEPGLQP
jgi:hypothetical protein